MNKTAEKVVGLGAGGHARVLIEILRYNKSYELIGLLDSGTELHGKNFMEVPVLGDDDLLPQVVKDGVQRFFVGLGGIGDNGPRRRLFDIAIKFGMKPVEAIHPQAVVSLSAELGQGVAVMAGAVINACVHLGENVIVNTGAVVEHDCKIGDHVHIATGARLAGEVCVGNNGHIGSGATVIQGILIGENTIVGAGAVVIKDVPQGVTVVGCPARIVGRQERY